MKEINLYILRNKEGLYIGKNSKITNTPSIGDYWLRKVGGENFRDLSAWTKPFWTKNGVEYLKRKDFYWERIKFIYKGTYVEK